MRIIALSTLKAFWSSSSACADSIEPGMAWYQETLKANWATPNDVKAQFSSASILKDGRAVFNIAGNKYRLVVWINYPYRVVYIRLSERTSNTTKSMHKQSEVTYGNSSYQNRI